MLYLEDSKTGNPHCTVLAKEAERALAGWPRQADSPFVFASSCDASKPYSYSLAQLRFKGAVKAAGLPLTGPKKITLHTLRHSFATLNLQKDRSPRDVGEVCGMNPQTVLRYSHGSASAQW